MKEEQEDNKKVDMICDECGEPGGKYVSGLKRDRGKHNYFLRCEECMKVYRKKNNEEPRRTKDVPT